LILLNVILLVCLVVGTIIFLERFVDARSDRRRKLQDLNLLYKCRSCFRYSRSYFINIKENCDSTYVGRREGFTANESFLYNTKFCPHCENGIADMNYSEDNWIAKHPDAPLLTKRNMKEYEDMREKISIIMYEASVNLTEKEREAALVFDDMLLDLSKQVR
jgi:hypothetical protein